MSKPNSVALRAAASTAATACRLVAAKADSARRPMTADEQGEFDSQYKMALFLKSAADDADKSAGVAEKAKDAEVLAYAKRIYDQVEGPHQFSGAGGTIGGSGSVWAKSAAERLRSAMPTGPDGRKAVVSGTVGVPNVIDPEIVRIGQVPTNLLDLVSARPATTDGNGGNSFSFLRQTVRTNNADPVADGALKPTSVYSITDIEDHFRVVAHLSEPVPMRYFADFSNLEAFLTAEMEYGLKLKLEQQIISGNGTGENFTGILSTSGIVAQAWTTDLLTTARKAITALQVNGIKPSAFLLSPVDCETFDLLKDTTGQFLLDGPGRAALETLWSIPRVPSTSLAVGTGILADWSQAELVVRQDAEVAVDTSGDLFSHNQAVMRVEGRFGLAVKRPAAFAMLDLTP